MGTGTVSCIAYNDHIAEMNLAVAEAQQKTAFKFAVLFGIVLAGVVLSTMSKKVF